MQLLSCRHCGTVNAVAVCNRCQRAFVITEGRIAAGVRLADDAAWKEPCREVQPCDFCLSKDMKEPVTVRVDRGVRQRTCPSCRKEFLLAHGLNK